MARRVVHTLGDELRRYRDGKPNRWGSLKAEEPTQTGRIRWMKGWVRQHKETARDTPGSPGTHHEFGTRHSR